jgi:hypothetical protein
MSTLPYCDERESDLLKRAWRAFCRRCLERGWSAAIPSWKCCEVTARTVILRNNSSEIARYRIKKGRLTFDR